MQLYISTDISTGIMENQGKEIGVRNPSMMTVIESPWIARAILARCRFL
jgi:hypothetical protein